MNAASTALLLPLALLAQPQERKAPPTAIIAEDSSSEAIHLSGVVVPAAGDEIELWPQRWKGELLFLEVRPHGSSMKPGDLIARFDDSAYRDQLVAAERKVEGEEQAFENAVARAEIEEQSARADLGAMQQRHARAQRDLEGWQSVGLELDSRGAELSALGTQYRIDDQVAELTQLDAMYSEDELVDATEDIVLERARRDLDRSRKSQQLQLDSRQYRVEYDLSQRTLEKEQALDKVRGDLERLQAGQKIAARERAQRLRRAERSLADARRELDELRADEELFTIRATQEGMLIHGGLEAYGPGSKRPDHARGGRGSLRAPLFTLVAPGNLAVALEVDEKQRARLGGTPTVHVTSPADDEASSGQMTVARLPEPGGGFAGRVALGSPLKGASLGSSAELTVEAPASAPRLVVPRAALLGAGDSSALWVAATAGADFQRVAVEVAEGSKGEEVFVSGAIEAGMHVLLAPEEEAKQEGTR